MLTMFHLKQRSKECPLCFDVTGTLSVRTYTDNTCVCLSKSGDDNLNTKLQGTVCNLKAAGDVVRGGRAERLRRSRASQRRGEPLLAVGLTRAGLGPSNCTPMSLRSGQGTVLFGFVLLVSAFGLFSALGTEVLQFPCWFQVVIF